MTAQEEPVPGQVPLWGRPGGTGTRPGVGDDEGIARESDPETSKGAASRVRPRSQRYRLLAAHREHPEGLTDEEAAVCADVSLLSEYATRCSELMRSGYLMDTPMTRQGDAGHPRMVRLITSLGLVALWEADR